MKLPQQNLFIFAVKSWKWEKKLSSRAWFRIMRTNQNSCTLQIWLYWKIAFRHNPIQNLMALIGKVDSALFAQYSLTSFSEVLFTYKGRSPCFIVWLHQLYIIISSFTFIFNLKHLLHTVHSWSNLQVMVIGSWNHPEINFLLHGVCNFVRLEKISE